jgi:hypothetical protein
MVLVVVEAVVDAFENDKILNKKKNLMKLTRNMVKNKLLTRRWFGCCGDACALGCHESLNREHRYKNHPSMIKIHLCWF